MVSLKYVRGAGRQTSSSPTTKSLRLKGRAVTVGIEFPSSSESEDDDVDLLHVKPPPGMMLDEELALAAKSLSLSEPRYDDDLSGSGKLRPLDDYSAPLTPLPVRPRRHSMRSVSRRDDLSESAKLRPLDDYSAPLTPLPARQRRLSMRSVSRGREREREHQGRVREIAGPKVPLDSKDPATPVLLTALMGLDKRRKRNSSRRASDAMPRSPLAHTEHGFALVGALYHCPVEACGFSGTSSEHVRHHQQTVRHAPLAKIHIRTSMTKTDTDKRSPVLSTAKTDTDSESGLTTAATYDETETF